MLQTDALIVDYGPTFGGSVVPNGNGIVCVVPRQLHPRSEQSNTMREMVESHGGTCGNCQGCPLGRQG